MKTQRLASSAALAALMAVTLSACAQNAPPGADTKESVATVNGKAVSKELFETYASMVARRPAGELTPEQKGQVLDQLINMQLAAELAVKNGDDKKPETESQLALARMNVLSEGVVKKYVTDHPITDAEIKAEYDTQVASMGRQYSARHILVDSKAAATAIIEQLKRGADFAAIARKESSDGSASKGGDLGWFSLSSMVKPFADAVAALDKGKYTAEPVQTQYGWHVIKLEDFRSPEAPKLEDVKEQVQNLVQRKKLMAYMDELRKTAKIEKKEIPAATPPAETPATAPPPAETK
jgi:peptidyl-prolyl cis-trans isomerase C